MTFKVSVEIHYFDHKRRITRFNDECKIEASAYSVAVRRGAFIASKALRQDIGNERIEVRTFHVMAERWSA